LIGAQRQALAWHPQEQAAQSQVPQQPDFMIFCEVDCFMSAMVVSFDVPARDCAVTEADEVLPKTLQFVTDFDKLPP